MNRYVLFYAVNGFGLGHLTRLLSIARKIQEYSKDIKPLFFTSSEAGNILYQYNIPYFKLPSKQLIDNSGLSLNNLDKVYRNLFIDIMETYCPEAIVIDTFIKGYLDELEDLIKLPSSFKKVFIHREQKSDKIDDNKINFQSYYDLIIAPHMEGTAHIPVPDENKLCWSGNIMIRDNTEIWEKNQVIQRFGLPADKKIVYLNFGGGGDKSSEKDYEQVMDILSDRNDIHLVVTQAPLSKFELKVKNNCTIINWYPVIELMNVFDIAISATGYNTYNELLYCGIPTVFIPKKRGLDDQSKRALVVEKNNAGFCLEQDMIGDKLNEMVNILLSKRESFSREARRLVPFNGADNAAKRILELL